jgi:anti-anti-sigma factor
MTILAWPSLINGRILSVNGPLTAPVKRDMRHHVRALLRDGERRIVLDLRSVSRIDAAGLGELVRAYNMAHAVDASVRVVNPSSWVRAIIERVGLAGVLLGSPFPLTRAN